MYFLRCISSHVRFCGTVIQLPSRPGLPWATITPPLIKSWATSYTWNAINCTLSTLAISYIEYYAYVLQPEFGGYPTICFTDILACQFLEEWWCEWKCGLVLAKVLEVSTDDDLPIERGDPVNPHGLLVGIRNNESLHVFGKRGG